MDQAGQLGLAAGIVAACAALGLARASFYRARRGMAQKAAFDRSRPAPARALNPAARAAVVEVPHQERFADLSVREVYAALLDEGRCLCSIATMYRLLRALGENRGLARLPGHHQRHRKSHRRRASESAAT